MRRIASPGRYATSMPRLRATAITSEVGALIAGATAGGKPVDRAGGRAGLRRAVPAHLRPAQRRRRGGYPVPGDGRQRAVLVYRVSRSPWAGVPGPSASARPGSPGGPECTGPCITARPARYVQPVVRMAAPAFPPDPAWPDGGWPADLFAGRNWG